MRLPIISNLTNEEYYRIHGTLSSDRIEELLDRVGVLSIELAESKEEIELCEDRLIDMHENMDEILDEAQYGQNRNMPQ